MSEDLPQQAKLEEPADKAGSSGGTRGKMHPMDDEQFFRKRWGTAGQHRDLYYNPNLSLTIPFTIRSKREHRV